jgi:hypothetical protein
LTDFLNLNDLPLTDIEALNGVVALTGVEPQHAAALRLGATRKHYENAPQEGTPQARRVWGSILCETWAPGGLSFLFDIPLFSRDN